VTSKFNRTRPPKSLMLTGVSWTAVVGCGGFDQSRLTSVYRWRLRAEVEEYIKHGSLAGSPKGGRAWCGDNLRAKRFLDCLTWDPFMFFCMGGLVLCSNASRKMTLLFPVCMAKHTYHGYALHVLHLVNDITDAL